MYIKWELTMYIKSELIKCVKWELKYNLNYIRKRKNVENFFFLDWSIIIISRK